MNIILLAVNSQEASNSFLLGNSQTFIGALATLVILYLYSSENNGNFFVSFVKHLGDEVKDVVNHYVTTLSFNVDQVFWSSHKEEEDLTFYLKTLEPIIKANGPNKELAKQLKQQLFQSVVEARKVPINFSDSFSNVGKEVNEKMDFISKSKEFEFIALFTLFFSILILSIDCMFKELDDLGYYFLYAFTISSSVFLLTIWWHLWRKTSSNYVNQNQVKNTNFKKGGFFYIKVIFLFILLPSFAIISSSYLNSYTACFLIVSAVYFVCVFLGKRIHFNTIKNLPYRYNRHYIASHFTYFLIAAFLVALICSKTPLDTGINLSLNWCGLYITKIDHFKDSGSFKEVLISFILMNVIILPFLFSFLRSKFLREEEVDRIKEKKKNAIIEIKSYKAEYNNTIELIKDLIKSEKV